MHLCGNSSTTHPGSAPNDPAWAFCSCPPATGFWPLTEEHWFYSGWFSCTHSGSEPDFSNRWVKKQTLFLYSRFPPPLPFFFEGVWGPGRGKGSFSPLNPSWVWPQLLKQLNLYNHEWWQLKRVPLSREQLRSTASPSPWGSRSPLQSLSKETPLPAQHPRAAPALQGLSTIGFRSWTVLKIKTAGKRACKKVRSSSFSRTD